MSRSVIWYEERQAGLGASFIAELGKVEELISANLELFGKVRRAILRKFPSGVFYVFRPNFISVIAALHHARNPAVCGKLENNIAANKMLHLPLFRWRSTAAGELYR